MDLANPPGLLVPSEGDSGNLELGEGNTIEGKQDLASSKKANQTWVEKAQERKSLRKYEVEVSTKEGKHRVEIPDGVISDSTPLWDDFIVGKFLDLAPHVAKVHMVVNKIWQYGNPSTKVDIYDVNATTMRFRVSSSKAREKILKRGMWNIAGIPMVVAKWTPQTEEEKQEEVSIPMWVYLTKVPLNMYSWEGISFMSSSVGSPDRLHPETIACTNLEVAKVFVNVDVTKLCQKRLSS